MIASDLTSVVTMNSKAILLMLVFDMLVKVSKSISLEEAEKYLNLGKECLSRGKLNEALSNFHSAIQSNDANYLSYYHRGTTYLALGNPRKAIHDFQRVVDLQPEFYGVRLTRIEVFIKLGDVDSALQDIRVLDEKNMYFDELIAMRGKVDNIHNFKLQADELFDYENYETAIRLLDEVLNISPYWIEAYSLKAKCQLKVGDKRGAIDSLKKVTIFEPNDYDTYFTIANLNYELGDWQSALNEVRKCADEDLHFDCYQFYKKLRKFAKMIQRAQDAKRDQDFDLCISKMDDMLRQVQHLQPMVIFEAKKLQASCYLLGEDYVSTLRKCDEALEYFKDPDLFCDKAEAYLGLDHFEDAVHSYNEALNLDPNFERAQRGKEQASRRQKQLGKRDYYKILGVSRNANDEEIKGAYRSMAKKWHPDKHQGDGKKTAEKRFRDAADAKEVLLDKEKRKLFDSGHDPLDPEQSQHQGHHQHFHGSPEDIFRMFHHHGGGGAGAGGSRGESGNQGYRFSFSF